MSVNTLNSEVGIKQDTTLVKAGSEFDILKAHLGLNGKIVIDAGCGTGRISRMIASEAAFVVGIDTPGIINLAKEYYLPENLILKTGTGQHLPLESNYADIIIYYASFHHIPEIEMNNALEECRRVLKESGLLVLCEPLTEKGSYSDLTSLIENEKDIREIAYACISRAGETNFHIICETFYFIERTFQDFIALVNVYISDFKKKKEILRGALEIILKTDSDIDNVKLKSLVRLNILQKN